MKKLVAPIAPAVPVEPKKPRKMSIGKGLKGAGKMVGFYFLPPAIVNSAAGSESGAAANYMARTTADPSAYGELKPWMKTSAESYRSVNKEDFRMDKLAENLGLKIESQEAAELLIKSAEAVGIGVDGLESLCAELDPVVMVEKIASEEDIPVEIAAMAIAESLTDSDIMKTASEKKVDEDDLAMQVLQRTFVPGEISKIAATTMIKWAKEGDLTQPLEKNAEKLGITKEAMDVTAIALELSSEGYSPEMLKEASEEMKIPFTKLASQILEGEKWADEKISTGALTTEMFSKIASSDRIPDGFFIGVTSAIEKLSGEFHPQGISSLFKMEKSASEDLRVHEFMKVGCEISGIDPAGLQFAYSYLDKAYALDKHAAVLDESHKDMAKLALQTVGVIGSLVSLGKLEIPEGIGETVTKIAKVFNESEDDTSYRLHVTNSILNGVHPSVVKEAGDRSEIKKVACELIKQSAEEDEHEKIAGAMDYMKALPGVVSKGTKKLFRPFSHANHLVGIDPKLRARLTLRRIGEHPEAAAALGLGGLAAAGAVGAGAHHLLKKESADKRSLVTGVKGLWSNISNSAKTRATSLGETSLGKQFKNLYGRGVRGTEGYSVDFKNLKKVPHLKGIPRLLNRVKSNKAAVGVSAGVAAGGVGGIGAGVKKLTNHDKKQK